jgi:LmbE family N-acetylglucosaminyl deacetylase
MNTALFLSPHLDDVAFSAGGTLAQLADVGWRTVLCTLLTESVRSPQGFALACQTDKGIPPEVDYMALRRAEDQRAAAIFGVTTVLHLPYPEAPHRGYESPAALFAGVRPDDPIRPVLAAEIRRVADELRPDLVFACQGLGRHTDHLQVIGALLDARLDAPVYWYRDTPYAIREPQARPDERLPTGLHEIAVALDEATLARKAAACRAYESQLGFQFGGAAQVLPKLAAFHRAEAARFGREGWAEALLMGEDVDGYNLAGGLKPAAGTTKPAFSGLGDVSPLSAGFVSQSSGFSPSKGWHGA